MHLLFGAQKRLVMDIDCAHETPLIKKPYMYTKPLKSGRGLLVGVR